MPPTDRRVEVRGLATRNMQIAFLGGAALGLVLYLWGALAAPVVLWSDSRIDMDWARAGIGIFHPVPAPPPGEPLVHPPKFGYLLFLRGAMRALPFLGEERSAVLVQSLLLWISIVATSWFLFRRVGSGSGIAALLLLLAVWRIRDGSSAVMSEAIAAAIFLPLATFAVWTPRRPVAQVLTGLGAAALFAIRPDVGAILFVIAVVLLCRDRLWVSLAIYAATFLLLTTGAWAATRGVSGSDPIRGIGHPILEASADYYWRPSLGQWPRTQTQAEMARKELGLAAQNWKRALSHLNHDTRRELLWRAFHGLLGTEFYDASWSRPYRILDTASRILTPFLILTFLAAIALPSLPEARTTLAGGLLFLSIVGHDLILGSNPRYLLPVLPFLLFLVAVVPAELARASWIRRAGSTLLLLALVALAFAQRDVLDWQWGRIESPGVTIHQPIPAARLPEREPATLHIRIATPLVPSAAHLDVFGPGARILYSSDRDANRQRPFLTIPLPAWLLEANRNGPVELSLRSRGGYGPTSYLLFPVIPPPWGAPARREGSNTLSPRTGVLAGSLDWWAHTGPPD
jgi:hypothetical protein